MAKLVEIGIFPEKKAPKQPVESAYLQRGGGIKGDCHAGDAERAISLMAGEAAEEIERKGLTGFCTSKFSANLTTIDLDYRVLRPGDRLAVGNIVLHIGQVGKECFLECPMEDKADCPIRAQCAFGTVEKGDILWLGDDVSILSC